MPITPASFGGFGGGWSQTKLLAVRQYFAAFNKALSKSNFTRVYIDAFAGGGRVKHKLTLEAACGPTSSGDLFPSEFAAESIASETNETLDRDAEVFRHGSPLLALESSPGFHEFIFIERNPDVIRQLQQQVNEAETLRGRSVQFVCEDANAALARICVPEWSRGRRAVIFLDPFALQIRWSTLEAIAATKGMDMWLLFPAMAVNRMLPRNGEMPDAWTKRLDETFGDRSWRHEFYGRPAAPAHDDLFPELVPDGKEGKFSDPFGRLSRYVTRRLKTIFADVVDEPLILKTDNGSPLFLLCFAVANEKGAQIAKRIASHIIKTQKHGDKLN